MKKTEIKKEIEQQNSEIMLVITILSELVIIAILTIIFNFGGIDKAIKCKRTNNGEWCNKYQLEKMGEK